MSLHMAMPYVGNQSMKLIIAFDVGISRVSYAFLIPGLSPTIRAVTQFPGQQKTGGDSKIPSVVCYDQGGNVVAVGSQADIDMNPELLEVQGLVRVEWIKLHLWPCYLATMQGLCMLPLPPNKTVDDILGDLLAYLHASTKQYIQGRYVDEKGLLESLRPGRNVEYVLSHPNSWDGQQQSVMRRAAIITGLVANASEALERITFVTEGEASLHFCLNKVPLALDNVNVNHGILLVDCGDRTIEINTYAETSDNCFKEIAPTEYLLEGSFFVTQRARQFLSEKLRGSRFGNPVDIDAMTRYFDKAAKQCYRGALKPVFLRFGIEENNPAFDIRSGCIKIQGTQVTRFFEPTIECIIKAIEGQFRNGSMPIKAVFMIGAFATNYYLSSKLDRHFKPKRIIISGPYSYGHPNKAVVEGAILFKLRETCAVEMNRPGAHLNEPGLSAETLSKSSETNSTLVRPKRINRVGSGPSLNEAIGVFFQVDHALTACIAKYTYGVKMRCHYDGDELHFKHGNRHFAEPSGYRILSQSY